jgi:hypothetical protein
MRRRSSAQVFWWIEVKIICITLVRVIIFDNKQEEKTCAEIVSVNRFMATS